MITKDDVLKAIVECEKSNGRTDFSDIMNKLEVDDISLLPFLRELKEQGYTVQTLEDVAVTSLGRSAYKDLTTKTKVKKSILKFSKFSLKSLVRIAVEIIVALVIAYLIYHFKWQ